MHCAKSNKTYVTALESDVTTQSAPRQISMYISWRHKSIQFYSTIKQHVLNIITQHFAVIVHHTKRILTSNINPVKRKKCYILLSYIHNYLTFKSKPSLRHVVFGNLWLAWLCHTSCTYHVNGKI